MAMQRTANPLMRVRFPPFYPQFRVRVFYRPFGMRDEAYRETA